MDHNLNIIDTTLILREVSCPAWRVLQHATGVARLLGQFRRAVDLLINDEVLALVTPDRGNGPFHVVVENLPGTAWPRALPLRWQGRSLWIGPWQLALDETPLLWDPGYCWGSLSIQQENLDYMHKKIVQANNHQTQYSPFVDLLWGKIIPHVELLGLALRTQNTTKLHEAVTTLAGWGPGLTPSGDDFLAGVLLASYVPRFIPLPEACTSRMRAQIYTTSAPLTNQLSRAFLRAARDGLANTQWHRLLNALGGADKGRIREAIHTVLNFGATSGLDMLLGFLWAGQLWLQTAGDSPQCAT